MNVVLKCKALLARSVVFITDSQYKAKWVHLARYFISRALEKLRESWGFLRSNIKLHPWEAPLYYQFVHSAAKDINDVFITFVRKSLAVKVIYAELFIVCRVKVRSKTLWQEKLGRTIPWSKLYLHSYKGFSTNQEHHVFFRVLHYVLKTVEYFSSWTRLHISLDCSFCWVGRPLFCKLLGDQGFVPSLQTLIGLDFVECFPMVTQRVAVYFLKLIIYVIWHFRKMKHFEEMDCTAQNAILLVEFSFKQTCSKKFEFSWRKL